MSKKRTGPVGIVGRLTLILLVTVTFLTTYSNSLAKYYGIGEDPTQKAISNVLNGASDFKPVFDEEGEIFYYEAYNGEGALIGFGFIKTGRGMWGDITVAGGINLDYEVTGVIILENSETPGLGARVAEKKFLNQFNGLEPDEIKLEKYGGSVDAISGATISSRSVTDIIRKEVERVLEQRSGME
jgi:electron transport complex protein RnfG